MSDMKTRWLDEFDNETYPPNGRVVNRAVTLRDALIVIERVAARVAPQDAKQLEQAAAVVRLTIQTIQGSFTIASIRRRVGV